MSTQGQYISTSGRYANYKDVSYLKRSGFHFSTYDSRKAVYCLTLGKQHRIFDYLLQMTDPIPIWNLVNQYYVFNRLTHAICFNKLFDHHVCVIYVIRYSSFNWDIFSSFDTKRYHKTTFLYSCVITW